MGGSGDPPGVPRGSEAKVYNTPVFPGFPGPTWGPGGARVTSKKYKKVYVYRSFSSLLLKPEEAVPNAFRATVGFVRSYDICTFFDAQHALVEGEACVERAFFMHHLVASARAHLLLPIIA